MIPSSYIATPAVEAGSKNGLFKSVSSRLKPVRHEVGL